MTRRLPLFLFALGLLAVGTLSLPGQAPAPKGYLLHVSKGQLPNDTGQDDKTKPEIVDDFKELGGKALKVAFAPGDSIGVRVAAIKNWKRFALLRIDAFNPAREPIDLELNVSHGRSTSFQTRVAMPIKLKPGKNEVKLGIDEMTNVNGTAPDLANVVRWYINDTKGKAPLVYFGDVWLEGGEAPPTPGAAGGQSPLVGYRIKGKIDGRDVDLTVTPFALPAPGAAPASTSVGGDPARLARLRAARMPKIDPILFDTPEADAIVSALEVFPPNNPWNLVVSDWPLHPNSKNLIASIGRDKPFRFNDDMGFVLVPPDQKRVDVKLVGYAGESDKGPFPMPDVVPIEGWPANYLRRKASERVTLDDVQRDRLKEDGDRHASVVDPTNRMLYEFYQLKKTDSGWQAAQSSIFDLKTNKMRPDGWTSTDAAGLPIFPATVRHDELKRGLVEHALRVSVVKTRRGYVYPATHYASPHTDENLPRMGERIRLRQDFDVSGFSPELKAILEGLKKYGMFVADNGIDWAISVAPDPRIKLSAEEFRKIKGSDFDVVQPPPGYEPPE